MPPRPALIAVGRRAGGSRRAFTLVEVLVVVAIIGVLVALLLPAVQAAREAGRRGECLGNLRQVGVALHEYHNVRGSLPIGCWHNRAEQISWICYLLPHLEQSAAADLFDLKQPYNAAVNRRAAAVVMPTLLCPSMNRPTADRSGDTTGDVNNNGQYDPGDQLAFSDYGGVYGVATTGASLPLGVFLYDRAIRFAEITDGTSKTIAVAEDVGRGANYDGQWANGENIYDVSRPLNSVQNNEIWSDHPGGAQVLMADGSAHLLPNDTDFALLISLCTRRWADNVDNWP